MALKAVLFDLDDTLVVDEAGVETALRIASERVRSKYGVNADEFYVAVRRRMRELWGSSPAIDYFRALGIASWEGLRATFEGSDRNLTALRVWVSSYKVEVWRSVLADFGIHDSDFAETLLEAYLRIRRASPGFFPETEGTLNRLNGRYALGLVTNGPGEVQREKLEASGLRRYFDTVVISAEAGVGKPDPAIFTDALEALSVSADEAAMVGDSLKRDVAGARAAGVKAIWVNRTGACREGIVPDLEIKDLTELESVF